MKRHLLSIVAVGVMILAVTGCSKDKVEQQNQFKEQLVNSSQNTASEFSTSAISDGKAVNSTQSTETVVAAVAGGNKAIIGRKDLDGMCEPLAAYISATYNSGEKAVDNDLAASYLKFLINMFYVSGAEEYPDIQGTDFTKYVAMDENEVNALLDIAFAGQYGTDKFMTDNNFSIYNGHKYYFGVGNVNQITKVQYEGKDEIEFDESIAYKYSYSVYEAGSDRVLSKGNAMVYLKKSTDNPYGFSISRVERTVID